jgi:hypothetical protein
VPELTCNGVAVLSGEIRLYALGRWGAYLTLDSADEVSGAMTLESPDGSFRMVGTVRRGGAFQERGHVELVGGADRMHEILPPQPYRGVPGRTVLRDLLRAVGETLSPTSNAPELDQRLAFWVRRRGCAAEALEALVAHFGCTWRFLLDGTVWLGRETWPVADLDPDVMDTDPSDDRATYAFDALPAALVPGVSFQGQNVVRVVHTIRSNAVRSVVHFSPSGMDPDLGDQQELIRGTMRGVLHLALWPAVVVAQDTDGTVQCVVQPDVPEALRVFPSLVGVPIRSFAPGVGLTVAAGTRCLVTFEAGDPTRPMVAGWQTDAGNFETVKLGANATKGAARVDDAVGSGSFEFTATGNQLTITYTAPGGSPQATNITFAASGGVVVAVTPGGGSADVTGKITDGSSKVTIE